MSPPGAAPSIPGIALGIVCVIYGSLGDFLSLRKMIVTGTVVFVLGFVLGLFGNLGIWIVTLIAFVVYINKAKNPFITPKMLTNPAFAMTMTVILVGYFFSYTLNAGINNIGINVFGLDSSQVSNLLVWSIILASIRRAVGLLPRGPRRLVPLARGVAAARPHLSALRRTIQET